MATIWGGLARLDLVRLDLVRLDLVRLGLVRLDLVWLGLVWLGGSSIATEARAQVADSTEEPSLTLGAPAAFGRSDTEEEVILLASGTRLHQNPARRTPTLDWIDVTTTLAVLERRGAWMRVRWGGRGGWVLAAAPDAIGDAVAPLASLPVVLRPPSADPARVAHARSRLGSHAPDRVSGDPASRLMPGYGLYTDLALTSIRRRLRTILAHIDDDVATYLGVMVPPAREEAVVVFEHRAAFRRFVEEDDVSRRGSSHLGQAHGGLAALSAEHLTLPQMEALFVHEVAHLVIRRTLGLSLPPWLEEGLAEDLAYHHRDDLGSRVAGSLSRGEVRRLDERGDGRGGMVFHERRLGGVHALTDLRRALAAGEGPELARLTARNAADFYAGADRLRYPRCAFFVRFLLQEHTTGFRAYLRAIARGDDAGTDRLFAHGKLDWPSLEGDFVPWLQRQEPR